MDVTELELHVRAKQTTTLYDEAMVCNTPIVAWLVTVFHTDCQDLHGTAHHNEYYILT